AATTVPIVADPTTSFITARDGRSAAVTLGSATATSRACCVVGRETDAEPNMGNFVYRRQFTVEWGHCDPAGIVFNSRFFEFFDWNAWLLIEAALAVRPNELATHFGIAGIPLVATKARFLRPAKFNDVAELAS